MSYRIRRPNANARIKAAMRANERSLLAHIKVATRDDGYYTTGPFMGSWGPALDRLVAKGLVRTTRRKLAARWYITGYVPTARGYKSR